MTIYDENQHPRGQADNAGQFRDKANSGPEAALTIPSGQARSLEDIVDDAIDRLGNDLTGPDDLQRIRAALEDAVRKSRIENPTPAFKSKYYPDKYRDLWVENMPRVSGYMYFAIPGEQPIGVDEDQARRILEMLSTEA